MNATANRRQRSVTARAYALVVVLLVLALIAVAVGVVMTALKASSQSTAAALKARQTFYACDGMVRTLTRLASTHLQTGEPTTEAIATALCAGGGGGCNWNGTDVSLGGDPIPDVRPSGYRVTNLQVTSRARTGCASDAQCGPGGVCFVAGADTVCRRSAPLPEGAFAGMQALSDTIRVAVEAEHVSTGHTCRAGQEVVLGKVALTQFFVFSAVGYTDWQPATHTIAQGRVHANGDLCLGGPSVGGDRLFIERLTSARDVNPMTSNLCRTTSAVGRDDVMVAKSAGAVFDANADGNTSDPVVGDFAELTPAERGGGLWVDDSNAAWNGQLKDRAHNVLPLALPIAGTPTVPDGRDAALGVVSNAASLRYLVDPVWPADTASVRAQKLAFKSDLRIINGVWFVNDGTWPGQPIWSDHPRAMTTVAGDGIEPANEDVGQSNIFSAAIRPQRYSYYRTTPAGALDFVAPAGTGRAVVSYGTLLREAGGSVYPLWRPGYRCPDGSIEDATVDQATVCGVAVARTAESGLLAAARSGFRDGHAELSAEGGPSQRADSLANVLPLNLDVGALQEALNDNGVGELGAVFTALGRPFNGIVYVTSSWRDATVSPPVPLRNGQNNGDSGQPAATAHVQRELPYALCHDPLVGEGALTVGATDLVFVPATCAGYRPGGALAANYNAVRVINARNINVNGSTDPALPSTLDRPLVPGGELPDGLTVVTNLPLYLLGDVNLSSNATITNPSAAGYQWAPVLLAGDVVSLLSNAWDDTASRWHESVDCQTVGGAFTCATLPTWPRNASTTRVHAQLLGGLPVTSPSALNNAGATYSGGLELLVRPHEAWPNTELLVVRGGFIVGHAPVYVGPPPTLATGTASAPRRDWTFDAHFDSALDQPPGVPVFDINAIRQWTRQ